MVKSKKCGGGGLMKFGKVSLLPSRVPPPFSSEAGLGGRRQISAG